MTRQLSATTGFAGGYSPTSKDSRSEISQGFARSQNPRNFVPMIKLNIPLEHALIYNHDTKDIYPNKRDPNNKNKYWFQHPPEWFTSNTGEKIIGFRSLFIKPCMRSIRFMFQISIPADGVKESFGVVSLITNDWRKLNDDLQNTIGARIGAKYRDIIIVEETYLSRQKSTSDTTMKYRNEKYWSYYNKEKIFPGAIDTFGLRFRLSETMTTGPVVYFMVSTLADDARSAWHAEDYVWIYSTYDDTTHRINCIEFYDVWDRKSCVVKSNLASGVQHNYLGESNIRYDPLKYFHVSDDSGFTVELMNPYNNLMPVVLPFDDQETINIEYVILQNATQLYT